MMMNSLPRAGVREWIGLTVLAFPTLLLALDLSVLYLALPHLSTDLGATGTQQLWITDIYGFMVAGFLVTMGTLGDRVGRRKLLLIGGAMFGIVSVLAAYSVSAEMLIAARAMKGIAGATLAPSTLALISNMFLDAKQRGLAIAVWVSCFMGGAAIGPVVGGLMLEWFWWGSVFLLGLPVMGLLLITAPFLLPEYKDTNVGRLDLASVILSLSAILPIIFALKELAKNGAEAMSFIILAVGLFFGVVFVRRQRKLASPLLDLRLFGNRTFSAALIILMFGVATQGGVMLLFSQYLQMVKGLSPLEAGLWLVPSSLAMVAGSMLAPSFAQKIRPGTVIAYGMGTAAVGFLLLTQVHGSLGLALPVIGVFLVFFGVGPMAALTQDIVVSSVQPEKAGSAAALSQTSGDFGIALGVASLGSIGNALYTNQLSETIPPDISVSLMDTALESIAGAITVAEQLPSKLAMDLLIPAREAFTTGLNAVAAVGAVIVIILAILAVAMLRGIHATSDNREN